MPPLQVQGPDALGDAAGETAGPSEWRTVTQEDIDLFARITGDDQWIHVDVERARKESPFGGTIAHGNLTLSMIDGFRDELIAIEGFQLGVNMGFDRVRFPAPVPADSRIRATAELARVTEKGDGWWECVQRFTVEIEDGERPACVADSVVRLLAAPGGGSGN